MDKTVAAALRAELSLKGAVADPVVEKWRAVGERVKNSWPTGMTAANAADFLYDDETGLPR